MQSKCNSLELPAPAYSLAALTSVRSIAAVVEHASRMPIVHPQVLILNAHSVVFMLITGRAKSTPALQAMMEQWYSRCNVTKTFYRWSQQTAPLDMSIDSFSDTPRSTAGSPSSKSSGSPGSRRHHRPMRMRSRNF